MARSTRRQCCRLHNKTSTVVRHLSYEGVKYELPLCAEHDRQAQAQLLIWANMASDEIDEDTVEHPLIGECDRCSWVAKVRKHLGWDRDDYLTQLCEKHADGLLIDVFAWARLGREVDDSLVQRVIRLTTIPDQKVELVQVDEQAPRVTIVEEPAEELELPAASDEWRMSLHAQERLGERGPKFGFTALDVMLTCVSPELRTVSTKDSRVWLYRRGPVIATVRPDLKLVLTVGPNTPGRKYDHNYQLQEA